MSVNTNASQLQSQRHTMQWSFSFSPLAAYLTPNYQALHELDQVLGVEHCARLLVQSLKCSLRTLWIVFFSPIWSFFTSRQPALPYHITAPKQGGYLVKPANDFFFLCITVIDRGGRVYHSSYPGNKSKFTLLTLSNGL